MISDEDNLALTQSKISVDEMNAEFYGRFPYPWRPMKIDYLLEPHFESELLNQSIGDWTHRRIPPDPQVWVAGCGTNQAVFTALRFPEGRVVGSDLSTTSLEICAATTRELGLSNLELKQESIHGVGYADRFDYIVCTGVIHHNASPEAALKKLAGALKPGGVLELMVYNRYHRITTTAFQKAVRILSRSAETINIDAELSLAENLIDDFPLDNIMSASIKQFSGSHEAKLADALIQPVEYSYTVESLNALADSCGLETLSPCISALDKVRGVFSWNMNFSNPALQDAYYSLPDIPRWQVSNLLMLEVSPMLWFYLQRQDSVQRRESEQEICQTFLDTKFERARASQRAYLQQANGAYKLLPDITPLQTTHPDNSLAKIIDSVDARSPMRDIFKRLDIEPTFQTANEARLKLTTSAYPYLKSIASVDSATDAQEQEFTAQALKEAALKKFSGLKRKLG